jgi:Flp pilus assembly protein TadD
MMRGFRRGLALLATGSVVAGVAHAQGREANLPPGAIVQPLTRDDGAELRGYLTTLADNPRSVDALVGAGRAAMRMGDVEAALTFFGRASELSPRDARAKAGMASGLLQMGQPQAALTLFAEAVGLGAPEVEIAGDRGLAYDLVGDPRRAQQDYLRALQRREDPEIERRMALSLAISGRRDAALRLIDDQLRGNDRAAWRTQAFVLALTGDAAGAGRTARGLMLPGQAEAMAPFLARLATLDPAQKAMAVHLGRFPVGGEAAAAGAAADISADPGAVALAMGGAPAAAPAQVQAREARSNRRRADGDRASVDRSRIAAPRSERRRRSAERPARSAQSASPTPSPAPAPAPAPPAPAPAPAQVAETTGRWSGAPYSGASATAARPTATTTPSAPPAAPSGAAGSTAQRSAAASAPSGPRPVELPPSQPATRVAQPEQEESAPGFALAEPTDAPTQAVRDEADEVTLAEVAELVGRLPAEERRPAPPFQAPPTRATPAETDRSTRSPFRAPPPRPTTTAEASTASGAGRAARASAHPSRHWVQIAGGANRAALPREFTRLREQAPDQLGRRAAYTAALPNTNRLLVGPFDSQSEAQEFVNQLAGRNVAAFTWTSDAGEVVERLRTR